MWKWNESTWIDYNEQGNNLKTRLTFNVWRYTILL